MNLENKIIYSVICHNGEIHYVKNYAKQLENGNYRFEGTFCGVCRPSEINKYEFDSGYYQRTGNIIYSAYCDEDKLDEMIDTLKRLTRYKITDIKNHVLSLEETIRRRLND